MTEEKQGGWGSGEGGEKEERMVKMVRIWISWGKQIEEKEREGNEVEVREIAF